MKNTSAVGQHKGNTCKNAKIVHKKKNNQIEKQAHQISENTNRYRNTACCIENNRNTSFFMPLVYCQVNDSAS